jgi:hypothetical protein
MMSIRALFFLAIAAWLVGCFWILALASQISSYFAWVLFPYMGLCALYIRRLRCPQCGKPVWINWGLSMPYTPPECSKCGHDLTGRPS